MRIFCVSILVLSSLFALSQNKATSHQDSLQVFFDNDSYALKAEEQIKINSFFSAKNDSLLDLKIYAYTDYLGSDAHNLKLSENRALSVKEYCKNLNQPYNNEIKTIPMGEKYSTTVDGQVGNPSDRRADIIAFYAKKAPRRIDSIPQNKSSLVLDTLKKGDQFVVEGMNFYGGRHFPTVSSASKFQKLLKALQEHPNIHIEIQGHICCHDADKGDGYDLDTGKSNLSTARAKYVYDYLIKNGIDAKRLSYKGFGATRKLYPKERNNYEQQQNRRVEIRVTQTDKKQNP